MEEVCEMLCCFGDNGHRAADLCGFLLFKNNFYSQTIQMGPSLPPAALILVLLALGSTMHIGRSSSLHSSTASELATLQQQQSSFEKSINNLIEDIQAVEVKVNATSDTNEKVILLEKAVTSERQKIHDLQTQIAPAFSLSKNSCQQLTSQQKVALLGQLSKAKSELSKLKEMAAKIPSNPQVVQVSADITTQETILASIDRVINSNCSITSVLTPTIFQSNLYATNWILGRQSINNIVEQYYQRSRQYHNVTNCPLSQPYYDGKKCVQCEGAASLFNMQTIKCESCPDDTTLNQTMHTCQQIQHYSNYNKSENYALDGASALPTPPATLTACPESHPYFAGRCISCALPSYWSVKEDKCKDCPNGEVFDINNKKCETPQWDTVTFLEGDSKWVTAEGNFTKVLEERAKIKANTTVKFNTCTKTTPYFDGVKCISCPKEFDLSTQKCCEAPQGKAFNPNLHSYVSPTANATTNPQAPNLLTTKVAASASGTTNGTAPANGTTATTAGNVAKVQVPANACPLAKPYYDGIACIQCPSPYPLFDNSTQKCVQCDPYHFYNSTSRLCQKRPLLYVSSNFTNVQATSKVSLPSYKAELLSKVNNSGQAIVVKCKPQQYSNGTACFTCPQGERFNLEEKKCGKCNGTVDATTLICQPLKTMLSNLDANNTIWGENKAKADFEKKQKEVTGPTEQCPKDKPYSVKGLQCISCNSTLPYFDLSKEQCVGCPKDLFYNSVDHKCDKDINITNVDAMLSFIQTDNYTRDNIKKQLGELSKTRKTTLCPATAPIASKDGSSCSQCTKDEFVDMKVMECKKGKSVSNVNALKQTGKVLELGTYTLASLEAGSKATITSGIPTVDCPADKPLYNGTACIACDLSKYYNLQELNCYQPKLVSNVNALAASKRYAEVDAHTLDNLQKDINSSKLPIAKCPAEKPMFDGTHCNYCPEGTFYNLNNNTCYTPQFVSNTQALTNGSYIESGRHTLLNLIQSNKASIMPTASCPNDKPLFNGKECISCPKGEYYYLKTLNCVKEKMVSNVDGLKSTGKVIERGQYTLDALKNKIASSAIPTKSCPPEAPLFNGSLCQACPSGEYYNLQLTQCYKPVHHTNITAVNLTHRVLERDNNTLQSLKDIIIKDNLPTKDCPEATPMLSAGVCIECPAPKYYDIKSRSCYKPLFRTNIEALQKSHRYIEIDNHTLKALNDSINKQVLPTQPCSEAAPILDASGTCHHCSEGEFYLLSNLTCIKAKNATNVEALTKSKLYIEDSTHTLQAIGDMIKKDPYPSGPCPEATPILKDNSCFGCPKGQYVFLSNSTCYQPENATNIDSLNKTRNYIQDNGHTLKQLKDSISASKLPTQPCPEDKPLFLNKTCFACPIGEYILLSDLTCYKAKNVTNTAYLEIAKNYIENDNHTLAQIKTAIAAEKLPTHICPDSLPVVKEQKCVACPNGQYYLLSNLSCYQPQYVTNVEAVKKSNSYVEDSNHTLAQLNSSIAAEKLPTQPCPADKPAFGGQNKTCFACPSGEFLLLSSLTCYKPKNVTNVDALKQAKTYVENENHTLAQLNSSITAEKLPTQPCPADKPVFGGPNKTCFACPSGEFLLLSNFTCYKPKNVTNVDALKQAKTYVENENHTLAQLNSSIAAQKLPTQSCPADKPVFGGQNKTCFACPSGEFLLLSNFTCYKPKNRTNVEYLSKSLVYIEVGNSTIASLNASISANVYPTIACPDDKPIFGKDSCIGCPKGQFIFLSNHSCYKPATFSNTNTLKTLANVVQRGNDTFKSIEEEIKKQTNPVAVCDSTEPMFNGTACVKCSDKEFYVLDKKKCEAPVWVSNTDALILANQYLETATANMTSLTESNKKTPEPKKACPTETPLFNGSACVSCSSSLYSLESMKCANCISSFYYDAKTHACKEKPNFFPNLTNNLWIVSTDSGIKNLQNLVKQRKALKNALECPVDKPHFNNDTKDCQKCLDKEFFDYDLRKCTVCGSGLEVDVNTRKCAKRIVGVYQTSLNTHNLLFEGKPKAQFQEEYDNNKKTYPSIQDCPTDKPYFDGFECIACPSSNPLFSLQSKLCSSCPEGSSYTASQKQCTSTTGQLKHSDPNMSKMYSSIF